MPKLLSLVQSFIVRLGGIAEAINCPENFDDTVVVNSERLWVYERIYQFFITHITPLLELTGYRNPSVEIGLHKLLLYRTTTLRPGFQIEVRESLGKTVCRQFGLCRDGPRVEFSFPFLNGVVHSLKFDKVTI